MCVCVCVCVFIYTGIYTYIFFQKSNKSKFYSSSLKYIICMWMENHVLIDVKSIDVYYKNSSRYKLFMDKAAEKEELMQFVSAYNDMKIHVLCMLLPLYIYWQKVIYLFILLLMKEK